MSFEQRYKMYVGEVAVEVHPRGLSEIKIDTSLVDGEVFYRKKLSGELVFYNDKGLGITDYDTLIAYEDIECFKIGFLIRRFCDGVWSDYFRGFFNKTDFNVDRDRCTIGANLSATGDKYNDILQKQKKKVNVLDYGTARNIYYQSDIVLESIICTETINQQIFGYPSCLIGVNKIPITLLVTPLGMLGTYASTNCLSNPAADYRDLGWSVLTNNVERTNCSFTAAPTPFITVTFDLTTTYFRQYKITDDVGGTEIEPHGDGWIRDGKPTGATTKWVRRPFPNLEPLNTSNYTQTIINDDIVELQLNIEWFGLYPFEFVYQNCRTLEDIVLGVATGSGVGFSGVSSQFFSNSNPISADDLSKIYFCPASEVGIDKVGERWQLPSNRSTIARTTWEELMQMFKDVFNVYWDINDDNEVVLEHIYYFENGNSYVGAPPVGLDLTTLNDDLYADIYIKSKNKYLYDRSGLVAVEEWDLNNSGQVDFVGDDISYTSDCIDDLGSVRNHNTPYSFDVLNSIEFPEINDNGFFLLMATGSFHNETVNGVTYSVIDLQEGTTEITQETNIPNSDLAISYLHEKYWKLNADWPEFIMNGSVTNASSIKKIIFQPNLAFPFCCDNEQDFFQTEDYTKFVKTELGDGKIVSTEMRLKDNRMIMTIKFENV